MTGHRPQFVGILGWPLGHTLSPAIHSAAFRRLGLDWTYLVFEVPPEELPAAVAGLQSLGAMGANVTMPHKEEVAKLLDHLSGDAAAVGAVNTIQRLGDKLVGHNTDVDGFRNFLAADAGLDVTGTDVLLLGSGGAARAVAKALGDLGAGSVTVAARRADVAAGVASIAGDAGRTVRWDEAGSTAAAADLVVNATPVGMNGEALLTDVEWNERQAVVDLIYDPPATPFVEHARACGGRGWGGLGMLVHQAGSAFRIWTGQDPPLSVMSAAAIHASLKGQTTHAE